MKHRVCRMEKCCTILSVHNPGVFCWAHTPEQPLMPFIRSAGHVVSEEFVAGMPGSYEFTAADRAQYKRGG